MPVLFKPEPKQQEFIDAVFSGRHRFLFFGGAAGGGKTYVGLSILVLLCKFFPGSKWMVMRKDYQKLKANTIPSFHKLVPKNFLAKFVDGVAYMRNGSQIIFKGEGFNYDKDLTWMDGLEVNGFLLEEVQEQQEATFNKAMLRAGRNIVVDKNGEKAKEQPPILILITGNPSQNWSKNKFVIPHREGKLEAPYFYLQALMDDNSYLTEEYKEGLSTLDSKTHKRYVKGDWDVIDVDCPFMYDFDVKKHQKLTGVPPKSRPLYLSFDFNVDPITCVAFQFEKGKYFHFFREFRLGDSNIYKLCAKIKEVYKDYFFIVTGDAAGMSRSALVKENVNYYTVIREQLETKAPGQMKIPNENPDIKDNRVLCNAILLKHPDVRFDPQMEFTIEDLMYVEVDGNGKIDKNKDKRRTHLLDCVRYAFNTFYPEFVKHNS